MELAYSDLLQANLIFPGGLLLNLELPLFFLDRNDEELRRTAWDVLRDRGSFHHSSNGDPIAWAADQIVDFLIREQRLAWNMAEDVASDNLFRDDLNRRSGLVDRVTRFDPSPIS